MGERVGPWPPRRWPPLLHLTCLLAVADSWVTQVASPDNRPGFVVFNAALPGDSSRWHYELGTDSAADYGWLFRVDSRAGDVSLRDAVECNTLLRNPVPISVRARSASSWTEVPLHVRFAQCAIVDPPTPETLDPVKVSLLGLRDNCFVQSQIIVGLTQLLPRFGDCDVAFGYPSSECCAIERVAGDLVARRDFCFPTPETVRTSVTVPCRNVSFDFVVSFLQHRSRRHAPRFERNLYIATVPEGRDRGYVVETMSAATDTASPSDLTYSLDRKSVV